ncbi:glycosyl hydrolase family 8 [Teredinibacter purpureus]|uniref:glycosyl hydrolase family 8 n=1 Tax=Teredinibacter purpureus TaxID=2731756 RepID=UPI000A62FD14|nr:glycosyl hydrolase family 8 [Teredinibacter purpureus]
MNYQRMNNGIRHALTTLVIIVIAGVLLGCEAQTSEQHSAVLTPPESLEQGSALTGQYRNLFIEAGYTQDDVQARLQATFDQLFYGDPQNERVYYTAGNNSDGALAYILDVNSEDVRSEGMSYGMMIALQLNKKAEFDAIWNWSMTHMYQSNPKHPAFGYFAWSVKPDGQALDEMPAPDGEEYFITALYFAAQRWGNGEGLYHYSQWANQILTDIRHRQTITGMTNRGEMTAGNLFDETASMVRFTPDIVNAAHTDASYHLPAFYEVWARVGPESDRPFWANAAQVSRHYFVLAAHPRTALTPDYGNFDGSAWAAPWRSDSQDFRYDAWRTAMNWSMDWAWWSADSRQPALSDRLQAFFESEGMDTYESLYTLDGKKLGGGQTTALVAMNATAGLAATVSERKLKFVEALWERDVPTGRYRYYDGMLYMMALLHCSGEYKAWLPPTAVEPL